MCLVHPLYRLSLISLLPLVVTVPLLLMAPKDTSGVTPVPSVLPSNFDDLAASELSVPEPGWARPPADGPGVVSGTPPMHPIFSTDFADPPTLGSAFIGPFVVDEPVHSLLAHALAQLPLNHSGSSNIEGQAPIATSCPFVRRCRPY